MSSKLHALHGFAWTTFVNLLDFDESRHVLVSYSIKKQTQRHQNNFSITITESYAGLGWLALVPIQKGLQFA